MIDALPALRRAALAARDLAIKTNTAIIVMRGGKIVRIPADELKRQRNCISSI